MIDQSKLLLDFKEYQDMSKGIPPTKYVNLVSSLKSKILVEGFVQLDKRMNRSVYALTGDFLVIKDQTILHFLKTQKPLGKYRDDWHRMVISFLDSCHYAKEDPHSRQLVVLNSHDFKNVKQCFTHMQFVYTKRHEFDLYVYQRSADLEKLQDDLVFFGNVAKSFEEQVNKTVTKIVVVYGNIHFTKE